MKHLSLLFLALIMFACGNDDDSSSQSCEFIGKWCTEDPTNPGNCTLFGGGLRLEFRANGELLLVNTATQRWESEDCVIIDVINAPTGVSAAEYEVVSLDGNRMTLDIGTTVDLIREQ